MSWAARHRRSPTTSWNPRVPPAPPAELGRTTIGCINPALRMEAASDRRPASSKCFRGWLGFGWISSVGIIRIPPGSWEGGSTGWAWPVLMTASAVAGELR